MSFRQTVPTSAVVGRWTRASLAHNAIVASLRRLFASQRAFQRSHHSFFEKLEKSAAETIPMLEKAFGVDCLSDRQIFRWHKAFAEGREDVNDENRAGRPSTSSSEDNVKRVRDLLNTDCRLSVRLISETLDITKTIVHEIVSETLGMRKACAKLVPKVLTDDQKARREHRGDIEPCPVVCKWDSTCSDGSDKVSNHQMSFPEHTTNGKSVKLR
ncbi:hypothetical protein NQ318_008728 [Aromia moschata]|uniref:Mos1 transposase HTH domain-containing protein n=1 Tax=Aromia moschata TaxID=1265417 RepID=A0AAV8XD11_9CUCU|nr:hypothetical protein NQ318_008728 [Aromia moschata]